EPSCRERRARMPAAPPPPHSRERISRGPWIRAATPRGLRETADERVDVADRGPDDDRIRAGNERTADVGGRRKPALGDRERAAGTRRREQRKRGQRR